MTMEAQYVITIHAREIGSNWPAAYMVRITRELKTMECFGDTPSEALAAMAEWLHREYDEPAETDVA